MKVRFPLLEIGECGWLQLTHALMDDVISHKLRHVLQVEK